MAKSRGKNKSKKKTTGKTRNKNPQCDISENGVSLLDRNGGPIEGPDKILLAAEFLKAGELVAVTAGEDCAILCNALVPAAVSRLAGRKDIFRSLATVFVAGTEVAEKLFDAGRNYRNALRLPDRPSVFLRLDNRRARSLEGLCNFGEILLSLPGEGLFGEIMKGGIEVLASACVDRKSVIDERKHKTPVLAGETADYLILLDSENLSLCHSRIIRIISGNPVSLNTGFLREDTPFSLPGSLRKGPDILALGSSEDSTVSVVKNGSLFLSAVSGALDTLSGNESFRQTVDRMSTSSGAEPSLVAIDLDPGCPAARYAKSLKSMKPVRVQHHFAHASSCMAEHAQTREIMAVVYDDGGFGEDGGLWGGEFLLVRPGEYERLGHLRYARIPGAGSVAGPPWRTAVSYIDMAYGYNTVYITRELFKDISPEKIKLAVEMLGSDFNVIPSSSMGNFLAAMVAIIMTSAEDGFEGCPAAALEELMLKEYTSIATPEPYPYDILDDGNLILVDPAEIVYDIVENMLAMKQVSLVTSKLFESIACFTTETCLKLREKTGLDTVVLSGGMFENAYLTARTVSRLEEQDFLLLTHEDVPPGDAGISVGQAYVARALNRK